MSDCPLADECPSYSEQIEGMGCQHYGNRGGAEWCQHYDQPIRELKSQPVKPGEQLVVDVTDIHESGAGIGRTDEGFILMVDGVLPDARARVKITQVRSNHARADPVERLPMEPEVDEDDEAESNPVDEEETEDAADTEEAEETEETEDDDSDDRSDKPKRPRLGSRDNFWGS